MIALIPQVKQSNRPASLSATLAIGFILLSVLSLLLASSFHLYFNFLTQQEVVLSQQQVVALEAANTVSNFVEQNFNALEAAAQVSDLFARSGGEQRQILERLLGFQPAFREAAILNSQGQEVAKISRFVVVTPGNLTNRADSEFFRQITQQDRYISPIRLAEITNDPLVTMAVPIQNVFGYFAGTLVAEVNLRFMWTLVDSLEIGQAGVAYVVNRQGDLIAFGNPYQVLEQTNLSHLPEVAEFINGSTVLNETPFDISPGIDGTTYVLDTHVPLGTPDWAVVVELPVTEAYQDVVASVGLSAAILFAVALVAGIAGVYVSRRLTTPLFNLTETASRIAGGELELEAAAEGPIEVIRLAEAFNSMTAQLQDLIGSLEERVANRTQRLETVAALGEHLNAVLDLNQLLLELVNQVKTQLGYHHVYIYILDEDARTLTLTAGTAETDSEKTSEAPADPAGHQIPLDALTSPGSLSSLVARAANSGQIIRADNISQGESSLLDGPPSGTAAEMAVPIREEGRVVGVLAVYQDRGDGFDQDDENLLRSLANQAAVAIRNARLFEEVEAALARARSAQARYVAEAWTGDTFSNRSGNHLYQQPNVPDLSEGTMRAAQDHAFEVEKATIIALNDDLGSPNGQTTPMESHQSDEPHTALVAPITLGGQKVGALQLHRTDAAAAAGVWTGEDLALVEAVLDQVAQAAENLRLFEETRQRVSYERQVSEITQKLQQAPTIDALVRLAADELNQALGTSHSFVKVGMRPERQSLAATRLGPGHNERDE